MKLAILGAGAWGTALAIALSARHEVRLGSRDAEAQRALRRTRESRYLPGFRLPDAVDVCDPLTRALDAADLVLVATATAGLRATLQAVSAAGCTAPLAWACKGFETGSGLLPHRIAAEALPGTAAVGALSGPSFAAEVAQGLPTALVLASADERFAESAARELNSERLRVYASGDVVGVELGGALKNVIAIAAGISDGLALGRNARAALITRGLAEITRLGVAMGGRPETFAGLAGLGDLVLTCTGELSRNREVGVRLAAGERLEAILAALGHISEGVASARAALAHARGHGVEMPITEAVCAVLFAGRAPREAVQQLLARDPRRE